MNTEKQGMSVALLVGLTPQRERYMADERSGYKRSASDRKLDQSAESANDGGQTTDTQHSTAAGLNAAESPTNDTDSDSVVKTRQQHDDAEKN
jgi:hypothetical protein